MYTMKITVAFISVLIIRCSSFDLYRATKETDDFLCKSIINPRFNGGAMLIHAIKNFNSLIRKIITRLKYPKNPKYPSSRTMEIAKHVLESGIPKFLSTEINEYKMKVRFKWSYVNFADLERLMIETLRTKEELIRVCQAIDSNYISNVTLQQNVPVYRVVKSAF